jgi:hypothetical protein
LLALGSGACKALPGSPGADGPQWERRGSGGPKRIGGLSSHPLCCSQGAASAQTTKAVCLAASGGAGVTADSISTLVSRTLRAWSTQAGGGRGRTDTGR